MRLEDKGIHFLVGNSNILSQMTKVRSLDIFNGDIIRFLGELSSVLLRDKTVRKYADIAAFAFWIRGKNLEKLSEEYCDEHLKLGRGIAFHITPSNIPIQFAVSLVYGLLSGNINIIRVSDRAFHAVDIICNAINGILGEERFEKLKFYMCIVRYGHNNEITKQLSGICDARIVWGGDRTIYNIRKFPIPPRTVELCFADRDSICLIDADKYLSADHKALAKDFYNDTYDVDQNACSSPRIIIWLGKRAEEAKKVFWGMLKEELADYDLPAVAGSEKLLRFCVLAAQDREISYLAENTKLVRIEIRHLSENLLDHKSGMGYFFEYTAEKLEEIVPLLRKSCQTVSYYGTDPADIKELVKRHGVKGVDRIVPVGHTQELSLEWDGINMIESLSRKVCISWKTGAEI